MSVTRERNLTTRVLPAQFNRKTRRRGKDEERKGRESRKRVLRGNEREIITAVARGGGGGSEFCARVYAYMYVRGRAHMVPSYIHNCRRKL